MGVIRQLPETVVAQIAAGEVIERPAFVVKELIENALDAQSSRIVIEIIDSGLTKIAVTDNGVGMTREDLLECYKRHTTSKLVDNNLQHIHTLGFRGEALYSIAGSSRMIISSKPQGGVAGTQLELNVGELKNVQSVGSPIGTRVVIEDLFATLPARKKFLKSAATEWRHMVSSISKFLLAYPQVQFLVTHNGKTIFEAHPTENSAERIAYVLGETLTQQLIPMSFVESYVSLSGYIAKPYFAATTLEKQYIFVNQRPVKDALVSAALKSAYGILLEPLKYPIAILFLTVPPEAIDVNVHPRKEQLHFLDNQFMFAILEQAVKDTLVSHNITFHNLPWAFGKNEQKLTRTRMSRELKSAVLTWNQELLGITTKSADIIQLHNTYLVTQTKHGIVLIDQHAAHERVLYEKFSQNLKEKQLLMQAVKLPTPVQLKLSLAEGAIVEETADELQCLGFVVTLKTPTQLEITKVPKQLQEFPLTHLFHELLEELIQPRVVTERNSYTEKLLKFLACRSAVKAGDTLTKEQAKKIITELEKIPGAVTCPHGRPVRFELSLKDLHRLFKRI